MGVHPHPCQKVIAIPDSPCPAAATVPSWEQILIHLPAFLLKTSVVAHQNLYKTQAHYPSLILAVTFRKTFLALSYQKRRERGTSRKMLIPKFFKRGSNSWPKFIPSGNPLKFSKLKRLRLRRLDDLPRR